MEETEQLKSSIADMKDILDDNGRVQDIIIGELNEVIKKYRPAAQDADTL